MVAWVLIQTDDETMGQELAQQTLDFASKALTNQSSTDFKAPSLCYMILDRPEDALSSIEALINSGQIQNWWQLKRHPAYKLLQHEPRFQAVDAKIQEITSAQRENLRRLEAGETL